MGTLSVKPLTSFIHSAVLHMQLGYFFSDEGQGEGRKVRLPIICVALSVFFDPGRKLGVFW